MKSKIKNILPIFVMICLVFCLCSCDGEEIPYSPSTLNEITTNIEFQRIDGDWETLHLYTFTDSATGIDYIICSNGDGITIIKRDGISSVVEDYEIEDYNTEEEVDW